MARSTGAHHSEIVKGSVGPLTHRVYRGVGTVSRHRSPSRVRLSRAVIQTPEEIPNCFARYNAGIGYTLRTVGSSYWLASLADLIGGFGLASQPSESEQPKWFASDPLQNNQPYILPDGVRQTIFTPVLSTPFTPPLEIWMIAADCGTPSINRIPLSLNSDNLHYFICSTNTATQWAFYLPLVQLLAPYSNDKVKVWRFLFSNNTLRLWWNGTPQSPIKGCSSFAINRLRLLGLGGTTAPYNRRLFEIAFWRRILNEVEVQLLLRFYRETFNIV